MGSERWCGQEMRVPVRAEGSWVRNAAGRKELVVRKWNTWDFFVGGILCRRLIYDNCPNFSFIS